MGQLPSRGEEDVAVLLRRCAEADASAFRRLYDAEASLLYGVALRITRDPALAADAVHDAMLQVWRNASRFDPARGQPRSWLASLVRYRALDAMARRNREAPAAEAPEAVDPEASALDRLQAFQEGAALHQCLQQVEPGRRGLVMLAFAEGLTHAEVAARVRQPLGTVKSSIRRALAALRSCLTAGASAPERAP